jgi:DMSO/TMAO reductase YedYZ molybdopterin-dependent catalytic subunit
VRRTDLSRRTLLRAAALVTTSVAAYGTTEAALRWSGAPGAGRRFSGSYRVQAGTPLVTQWLTDGVPSIDRGSWSLAVATPAGVRHLSYEELDGRRAPVRAVLDCTGGWFAEEEWNGTPLADLIGDPGPARSIVVTSVTGYVRRFPASDARSLWVATRMRGRPLAPGHGFPARLVAPGRRGFWWVKWVSRIDLSPAPWWLQPPFPLS